MPIVRLRELDGNQLKKLPDSELRRPRREPKRVQLLAIIADLRHKSSARRLDASNRLIEKSRRTIFETELRLTISAEFRVLPKIGAVTASTFMDSHFRIPVDFG